MLKKKILGILQHKNINHINLKFFKNNTDAKFLILLD